MSGHVCISTGWHAGSPARCDNKSDDRERAREGTGRPGQPHGQRRLYQVSQHCNLSDLAAQQLTGYGLPLCEVPYMLLDAFHWGFLGLQQPKEHLRPALSSVKA